MSQGLCSPSYMMPSNLEAAIAWAELMSIGTNAEKAMPPFSIAPTRPFNLEVATMLVSLGLNNSIKMYRLGALVTNLFNPRRWQ